MIYDVYVKLVVSGHPPIWQVSDVPGNSKIYASNFSILISGWGECGGKACAYTLAKKKIFDNAVVTAFP